MIVDDLEYIAMGTRAFSNNSPLPNPVSQTHDAGQDPGQCTDYSGEYAALSRFWFRQGGPNNLPSAAHLVSSAFRADGYHMLVNSPRVADEAAKDEPAYFDVVANSIQDAPRDCDVFVDLSGVTYMTSLVIKPLRELADDLERNGLELTIIAAVHSQPELLLELFGFEPSDQHPVLGKIELHRPLSQAA